jgi:predicted secreted Zn-dependent protease
MIRTLLISTAALALAGAAQAADIVKVSVHGKTEAEIKVELAHAAKAVCGQTASSLEYDACVQDAYDGALQRWEKVKAAKLATLTF